MNLPKLYLVILLIYSAQLSAQCCSGGVPLSNNLGLSQEDKGTIQIGLNYDYNNLNTLNAGRDKLDEKFRLRTTHSILLNASYAFTNNFSAEGLFTWVNQRRIITSQFDGRKNTEASSGIGDAIILLKYRFPNVFSENSDLTLGLGTKTPIGSSTEIDSRGIILINDLQPGSNAWDFIYWLSASKRFNFRPTLNTSIRFTYRNTGTDNDYLGNSTYKYGNEFQGFLSFSDQFLFLKTITTPSLSFKYRNAIKDQTGAKDIDNTGGNWVFIIPNFSINITPNIVFSTKAELPIYSNVDGTQLTPTYRITSGLLLKLKPKPKSLNFK